MKLSLTQKVSLNIMVLLAIILLCLRFFGIIDRNTTNFLGFLVVFIVNLLYAGIAFKNHLGIGTVIFFIITAVVLLLIAISNIK